MNVLVNLLANAIEASPEGETGELNSDQKRTNFIIDVRGNRGGIPLRKEENIFSSFFTTKSKATGLRLPIEG